MAEYIERDGVVNWLKKVGHLLKSEHNSKGKTALVGKIIDHIENCPAADVVEVVRCRGCKHWHESTGYCEKHSYFIGADDMSCSPAESPSWTTWDEDDFCSDGQRKEG